MGDFLSLYSTSLFLKEAIFKFGSPELIERFNETSKINQPSFRSNSLLEILNEGLQGIQTINAAQNARNKIYEELKLDIVAQIQSGKLIALGLELPINSQSQPTQIPPHLFSGDINWENSELKFKNLEFSGIRLLKDETKETQALQNLEFKKELNEKATQKRQLADLDPNSYLKEMEVSEILNMSPRTLQGYRMNGGGPEFETFGRAVRYKVSVLMKWAESNRRKNTIR